MTTRPFKIHVPDHKLERLRQKLALTDYPTDDPTSPNQTWGRGVPSSEIRRLAMVWQTSFDWRKVEAQLNKFPQFLTSVEVEGFGSYDIHHIHSRSPRSDAVPLLFLHGWPGSFIEVTRILEGLVQGADGSPVFHVIAPSLIDFGFSSSSGSKPFGMDQHAEALNGLMLALGYNQYMIQSGDVGSLITRFIALKYGRERCLAYHTNTSAPAEPTPATSPEVCAKMGETPLSNSEMKALERSAQFSKEGLGYYQQLSTKPQTIAYCLRDSPVGLLAWIYEKMHDWSDDYAWTDEEVLT
ncbi:alpha/beta-hydrolase [Penicillium capsulatum]|uniref:Alpha/beta-hydrolase n=1 Tax=Penicillium capsulatum TaxID=69766 RepID=A0A9W9ILI9_9EURO|nr:alpha/beta-hydrolase [Penicillium capsulatum]